MEIESTTSEWAVRFPGGGMTVALSQVDADYVVWKARRAGMSGLEVVRRTVVTSPWEVIPTEEDDDDD